MFGLGPGPTRRERRRDVGAFTLAAAGSTPAPAAALRASPARRLVAGVGRVGRRDLSLKLTGYKAAVLRGACLGSASGAPRPRQRRRPPRAGGFARLCTAVPPHAQPPPEQRHKPSSPHPRLPPPPQKNPCSAPHGRRCPPRCPSRPCARPRPPGRRPWGPGRRASRLCLRPRATATKEWVAAAAGRGGGGRGGEASGVLCQGWWLLGWQGRAGRWGVGCAAPRVGRGPNRGAAGPPLASVFLPPC